MGILGKRKKLITSQENIDKGNIYEDLGIVQPFTALENGQMRSFIGDLSKNKRLTETEREAFESLWNAICIDIDGFGNNIWNLREGHFTTYEKGKIKTEFEKKSAKDIDDSKYTDEGRITFTYKSDEGNIVIHQNERNKSIFLAYVSEDISERLYDIFREVEAQILKLKREKTLSKYEYKVDESEIRTNQLGINKKQIEEKDRGDR